MIMKRADGSKGSLQFKGLLPSERPSRSPGLWRRLFHDKSGVIGMMFGIMLIPLLGAVGVAMDATRYYTVRDQMQFSMDTGGIGIGTFQASCVGTCSAADTTAEAGAVAQVFYNANMGRSAGTLSYVQNGAAEVDLATAPLYTSSIMGLLRVSSLMLSTQGTYKLPVNVEVAMVLDNTTSMQDTLGSDTNSKINELISATKAFLVDMKPVASAANRVKVAMVPFTSDVNVKNLAGYNSYINWNLTGPTAPQMLTVIPNTTCPPGISSYSSQNSVMSPNTLYISTALSSCTVNYGVYRFPSNGWGTNNVNWSGCVIDRSQPYDIANSAPTTGTVADSTWYVPDNVNCQAGPVPSLGLTDVYSDIVVNAGPSMLNAEANKMIADGFTNLSIGFFWGWQILSPGTPGSVSSSSARTQKYVIIMTDGQNTMNRWVFYPFYGSTSSIDSRTKSTCDAIKADQNGNIKIFTVGTSDADTSLLNYCSSGSNYRYVISDASQLTTAFNSIASQISNLRIAS